MSKLSTPIEGLLSTLDEPGVALVEAYIATWERLISKPSKLHDLVRHTHARVIMGQDDPTDRRAVAGVASFIFAWLRANLDKEPDLRKVFPDVATDLESTCELFSEIASGSDDVSIDDTDKSAQLHFRDGVRIAEMRRPLNLAGTEWLVQIGSDRPFVDHHELELYASIAGASVAARCIENNRRVLAGEIGPAAWMEQWDVFWRRALFRTLMEPRTPHCLRRMSAAFAVMAMDLHRETLRSLGEKADGVMRTHNELNLDIWRQVLTRIANGGFVLMMLSTPQLATVHIERGERYGGGELSPLNEGIMETFTRVSVCDLLPPAELESLEKEKPAMSTQKIGRNSPCPCGSGKKYKRCCLH